MYTHRTQYYIPRTLTLVQLFISDSDGVKICLYNNTTGISRYLLYILLQTWSVYAFTCIRNFNGFSGISNKLMESKTASNNIPNQSSGPKAYFILLLLTGIPNR